MTSEKLGVGARTYAGFPSEETGSFLGSLFSTFGRKTVPARLGMPFSAPIPRFNF
jgi:hypothetical protein